MRFCVNETWLIYVEETAQLKVMPCQEALKFLEWESNDENYDFKEDHPFCVG